MSAEDGGDDEHESQEGRLQNLAGTNAAQIEAHQYGDGHGHGDGERSPGTRLEGVDDDERGDRQQNHNDAEHGDVRDKAADAADFRFRHLGERFAVAAHREEQDDEVLHTATQNSAGNNPERARQISKLCGEHGTDQRSGTGDGSEVVSEDDPLVGRNEVAAVIETLRRRSAQRIERQQFGRDKTAVEAVSDGVGGDGGYDQPQGVDLLAAMQRDRGESKGSEQADGDPEKVTRDFWHGGRRVR